MGNKITDKFVNNLPNLCCHNCIYRCSYEYITPTTKIGSSLFTKPNKASTNNILCLMENNKRPLTAANEHDAQSTCNRHDLGTSFAGVDIKCPVDLEACNQNTQLKILFNLRPDIIERFKNIELLQQHEKDEKLKWKDYPV